MEPHFITCDRKVNVTVVSLLGPGCHAQEPPRVGLREGADEQRPVWLLVMPEGSLKSALKEESPRVDLCLHTS